MGHSTISFSKKGKLTHSEIISEFKKKQSEDRDVYGHRENPDSFYQASIPNNRYLGPIYSPKKVNDMFNTVGHYESYCLYSIPQSVFTDLFKKEFQKIKNKQDQIRELNEKLVLKSNEITKELGFGKSEESPKKKIFFTTPCCESKINVSAYGSSGYQTPKRCPVCGSNHTNNFESIWREKVLGKSYSNFRNKINSKIEKLNNEIKEIESSLPTTIEENSLSKKQKEEIRTVVFADVHH